MKCKAKLMKQILIKLSLINHQAYADAAQYTDENPHSSATSVPVHGKPDFNSADHRKKNILIITLAHPLTGRRPG